MNYLYSKFWSWACSSNSSPLLYKTTTISKPVLSLILMTKDKSLLLWKFTRYTRKRLATEHREDLSPCNKETWLSQSIKYRLKLLSWMQKSKEKQKWSKPLGMYHVYCSKMLQAHAIAMSAWGRKSWVPRFAACLQRTSFQLLECQVKSGTM